MYPISNNDLLHQKLLIKIQPLDPSALNTLTTGAKAANPTIASAAIAQSWGIYNLNFELGLQPLTQVGDAIICMVGSQPWSVVRFMSMVSVQPANGIIQALSYSNYFQNQIEVA